MRLAVILMGMLCGPTSTAYAHVGDRLFSFFELTDEDLAHIDLKDGSADDWRDVVGEPSLTTLDFFTNPQVGDAPVYDPADLDFQIWLGWHRATNRIYVAMERSDNVYINQYEGFNFSANMTDHDSSILFMVDGDHSGGEYGFFPEDFSTREEWRQVFHAQAQGYWAIAHTPDSWYVIPIFFDGINMSSYVDGGGGIFGEAPTISVTEFYVTPFDRMVWGNQEESVVSALFPGKVIGFAIQIGDFDTVPKAVHGAYLLPPSGRSIFTADFFADGVLVGVGSSTPEVSAVENDSWGRIKASFDSR